MSLGMGKATDRKDGRGKRDGSVQFCQKEGCGE